MDARRLARIAAASWSERVNYLWQIRRYRLPLRAAVWTAHGVILEREGVIVRLEDEAGRVGFGEAAPVPGFGGGTVEEVAAAWRGLGGIAQRETLGEALGGRVSAEQLDDFSRRFCNELPCVNVAVESALAEIRRHGGTVGQFVEQAFRSEAIPALANRPEAERRSQLNERPGSDGVPALTHGATGRVAPDFLPVAALLPAGRAAAGKIGVLAEAGFRTFKWKVGVAAVGEELPLLDEVCAELPKGARLRLDANGAWDRRTAERWLERCAERPVEFVEQPCAARAGGAVADKSATRREEDLLRGLAEDYPTAIALDESLVGEGDVARWLAVGWRGVWVVKPSLLGGAALARLRAAHADVVFSSALETAVGARAALRVAFEWAQAMSVAATGTRAGDGRPKAEDETKGTAGTKAASGAEQPPRETIRPVAPNGSVVARASRPLRALGFGVWPLFADARFDGPYLAPFLQAETVERINVEAVWNALN